MCDWRVYNKRLLTYLLKNMYNQKRVKMLRLTSFKDRLNLVKELFNSWWCYWRTGAGSGHWLVTVDWSFDREHQHISSENDRSWFHCVGQWCVVVCCMRPRFTCSCYSTVWPPPPPLDNIRVMVMVWRLRGNIIRTCFSGCWMWQLVLSVVLGSSTVAWRSYISLSCTGWTFLDISSINLVCVHRCLQSRVPQYLMDCCTPTLDVTSC